MCKIFTMTNMQKVNFSKQFVETVRDEVCRLSDKDGFGFAALDEQGSIGGERTIRPFNHVPLASQKNKTKMLPIVLEKSNIFGHFDRNKVKAFIAHGRLSTNDKTLSNTHPFADDTMALIHNGIVTDEYYQLKDLKTTCDTEIAYRFFKEGGIKKVERSVSGYYALSILTNDGKLHIARDDRAMLYIAYSRTVDSYLIATTTDIIKNIAKKMKWHIEDCEEILDNIYAVFDRNEIVQKSNISPIKKSSYGNGFAGKANKALGLDDDLEDSEGYTYFSASNWREVEYDDAPSYRDDIEDDECLPYRKKIG